ncbi:MAG TPA: phage protein Gp37 [Nitrospirota bacterium]|jgi:phage gp37-like protein
MAGGGYSKSEIELAVMEALRPLTAEAGGYLRTLGKHPGSLSVEELKAEALQLPAVFVSYISSAYSQDRYCATSETMLMNIYAAARVSGRHDAISILEDVRDNLCGSTLGLSIKPFRVVTEEVVENTVHQVVVRAVYSTGQQVGLSAQSLI